MNQRLITTRDEVQKAVESGSAQLVDARPEAFFNGETRHQAAKYPGTLKGAVNLEHSLWFEPGTSKMVTGDSARSLAANLPANSNNKTVSFCNTGHWAATNWFVLSELLGHHDVKLYPESVVEWSNAGLAMDNVPGRLQQFWLQLKVASGAP